MSLDKAIEHGKEHRKPWYDSRRFDRSCRNHGSCDYCRRTRTRSLQKQLFEDIEELVDEALEERGI